MTTQATSLTTHGNTGATVPRVAEGNRLSMPVALLDATKMKEATQRIEITAATDEEIEKLLDIADKIQEDYDKIRKSQTGRRFWLVMSICIFPAVQMCFALNDSIHHSQSPFSAVAYILTAVSALISVYFYTKYNTNKIGSAVERSLGEVVELLREVEPVVAQQNQWSVLKKAYFRIRMSRFDISR